MNVLGTLDSMSIRARGAHRAATCQSMLVASGKVAEPECQQQTADRQHSEVHNLT